MDKSRALYLGIVLWFSVSFMAGCSSDDRQRILVYSPHGKEMLSMYEDAYEAQHPDVDIQWIDMGGQDAFDRIRTESANPQASLWWGGAGGAFAHAADEGLLEAYTPSWADHAGLAGRGEGDMWFGTYLTPEVIAYNSASLDSSEVPKDWDDLLTEKWKGRLLIRYPMASSTMRTIYGAMILRQETVGDGYKWLAELDRNVKTYTADPTQLYIRLARGEGDVTLWNLTDIFIQSTINGYPFGFEIPESGTPILTDGIALVKGGPNLDIARSFYEMVTSDTATVTQAHKFYRIPVRTDIDKERLPDWMSELDLRELPLDWERLDAEIPTWMQYWDENIKGRGKEFLSGD